MLLISLYLIVLGFARSTIGDDNVFIYPTAPEQSDHFVANIAFPLGPTQKIQWSTNLASYYISLLQQNIDPASPGARQVDTIYQTTADNSPGDQSFNWTVQIYDSDLNFSPVCYLLLGTGTTSAVISHYFNITNSAQSSSSSSSSTAFTTSTASMTSIVASSTLTASSQTNTATIASSSSNAGGSSDTVKVGLGVGLGIGMPLVLIAGIWIGLKSVQQRQTSSHGLGSRMPLSQYRDIDIPYPPDAYPPPNDRSHYTKLNQEVSKRPDVRHEASAEREPVELGPRNL